MKIPENTAFGSEYSYFSRVEALRQRVADAAQELNGRGIRPTVARIRAALGGGSPNDLAPALKHWKDSFAPAASSGARTETRAIPIQISDLANEMWQRASIAAVLERKGGAAARALVMRTEEAQSLKTQVTSLRDQLQHESMALGELRAQAARHEAVARDALARLDASEARERRHLRDLGSARERITELEATLTQLREQAALAASRRRSPTTTSRSPKPAKARRKKSTRIIKTARKKTKLIARASTKKRRPSRPKR
ncbi:MAG: DNA-binding protein [Candidatus Binataceae bacterium]